LRCRVAPEQIAHWRSAAASAGLSLSGFVRDTLDETARRRTAEVQATREAQARAAEADPLQALDELLARSRG
jgi:hypothetical protein